VNAGDSVHRRRYGAARRSTVAVFALFSLACAAGDERGPAIQVHRLVRGGG
jgi:hypothetical protein